MKIEKLIILLDFSQKYVLKLYFAKKIPIQERALFELSLEMKWDIVDKD